MTRTLKRCEQVSVVVEHMHMARVMVANPPFEMKPPRRTLPIRPSSHSYKSSIGKRNLSRSYLHAFSWSRLEYFHLWKARADLRFDPIARVGFAVRKQNDARQDILYKF